MFPTTVSYNRWLIPSIKKKNHGLNLHRLPSPSHCRPDPPLQEQTTRIRLLHDGPDKRGGSSLLSQGITDRACARGDPFRHRARHLPTHLR